MRLTRQRWDTLMQAMCYWETEIETMELVAREDSPIDTTDIAKDAVRYRRQFESTMEYLLSIDPKRKRATDESRYKPTA